MVVGGWSFDMTTKAKTWEFVVFNYTEETKVWIKSWDYTRLIAAEEVCPETGNMHIQGKVTWPLARRKASIKKQIQGSLPEEEAEAEWVKWTWIESLVDKEWNYANKQDSIVFVNENRGKQGRRSDIDEMVDYLKNTKERRLYEIKDNHPKAYFKYSKHVKEFIAADVRPREDPPKVFWLWGPTGTGKTDYIYRNHEKTEIWRSSEDLKWFDGYYGHKVALLDEFRKTKCTFDWLLQLLDKYPLKVAIKGSFVDWRPETIYITSDRPPTEMWPEEGTRIDQLIRRITEIRHHNVVYVAT